MSIKKQHAELDKYYTKKEVAQECYNHLKTVVSMKNVLFIEPSAGSGAFLEVIKEPSIGFDLLPTGPNIIKNDFLKGDLLSLLVGRQKRMNRVIIGNPPFGTKSTLAIAFVNKALEYSDTVGFIIPIQFRKWSVQSKINKDALLIMDMELQENAFEFMGKDYNCRCCFQVWSTKNNPINLRIKIKPSIIHPDFIVHQYNRTPMALKYFDMDWDFAVPRQGFNDYSMKAYKSGDCDRRKQWIFFKAKNKEVLNNLLALDFTAISRKNIGIPGFGKADVIGEYVRVYGK
ncbi:MAG: hypothetical protein LUQ26_05300 [Methylococcaceae bacterium]|nr:hypothetical protein [Methylococcaceae bacterium]